MFHARVLLGGISFSFRELTVSRLHRREDQTITSTESISRYLASPCSVLDRNDWLFSSQGKISSAWGGRTAWGILHKTRTQAFVNKSAQGCLLLTVIETLIRHENKIGKILQLMLSSSERAHNIGSVSWNWFCFVNNWYYDYIIIYCMILSADTGLLSKI